MNTEIISKIATIVDTLLQVGERVVEVSEGYVISRIWDRKGSTIFQKEEVWAGKNLADLPKEYLAAKCAEKVTLAISTEENQYFECEAILDFSKQKFGIRILPIHPEKDKLFIVIELLQVNRSKNQPKGSSKQESPVLSEIRNEIEVRFEQQRLYYERILNNISADIAVLDADYRFLYVNPANVRDEETRKWLIGKTDEEFFIHRNKSLVIAERRKRMYEAARNERQVIEWIEKTGTLTGTIKTTLRRIYPVFDEKGNLDIIIGYSMNISELISAQEELKTTREIFESAFHDSGIGMALISAGGRWLDVNKVMCELTGYSKEELMRTSIRAIAYPGEWELDRELIKKMLLKEIPNFTVERRYISKQSKIVTVLLTLSVVWGTNEMPGFFIAQAIDVTVKKELEDVVTRKNSELEATK